MYYLDIAVVVCVPDKSTSLFFSSKYQSIGLKPVQYLSLVLCTGSLLCPQLM